jgi:cysteinyl-tRNA synthetase
MGASLCRADLSEQDVEESIARRAAARAAGDYAAADAERAFLAGKGILIMDGPSGTVWRPGSPEAAVATPAVK